jgi:hypothetical protein
MKLNANMEVHYVADTQHLKWTYKNSFPLLLSLSNLKFCNEETNGIH